MRNKPNFGNDINDPNYWQKKRRSVQYHTVDSEVMGYQSLFELLENKYDGVLSDENADWLSEKFSFGFWFADLFELPPTAFIYPEGNPARVIRMSKRAADYELSTELCVVYDNFLYSQMMELSDWCIMSEWIPKDELWQHEEHGDIVTTLDKLKKYYDYDFDKIPTYESLYKESGGLFSDLDNEDDDQEDKQGDTDQTEDELDEELKADLLTLSTFFKQVKQELEKGDEDDGDDVEGKEKKRR